MDLRLLDRRDAPTYRSLMLDAYASHPEAFTSSVAERAGLPLAWWEARVGALAGQPQCVIGAFDTGQHLAGAVGLSFEPRDKLLHKSTLFGMVVERAFRGQGLGRRLVAAALARARARAGVRLVQLSVTEGNRAAQALYARCGFVVYGREPLAMAVDGGFVIKLHLWLDLQAGDDDPARAG